MIFGTGNGEKNGRKIPNNPGVGSTSSTLISQVDPQKSNQILGKEGLNKNCLVVWNIFFFHILGIVTPTDELRFFRGVETTNEGIELDRPSHF